MIPVPQLVFTPVAPANTSKVLAAMINSLIEAGVPEQVGVPVPEYRADAAAAIDAFEYDLAVAGAGLTQLLLVDYRVSPEFIAKRCGVNHGDGLDALPLWGKTVLPAGLQVVMAQFGPKYRQIFSSREVRRLVSRRKKEQPGVPLEGLIACLYGWYTQLESCGMEFPGVVYKRNLVSRLVLDCGLPEMEGQHADCGSWESGAVTVWRGA